MAEPARKLPQDPQDDYGWQPRVITGGGEGGGSNIETPNQEAARGGRHLSLVPPLEDGNKSGLDVAERVAAQQLNPKSNVADQEKNAKPGIDSADDLYKKSQQNVKRGGKRGIFIGLGAGGGIISVVAGFAFLSPFKLQGIMDTVIGRSGDRLEHITTRTAEKILIKFLFDGDKIATGNPIGDLFANFRTSRFEVQLKEKHGLSFERAPNGALRLTHDGTDLGNFKNAAELEQYIGRDDLNSKELRKVFRLVVNNEKSIFKFWQRTKFVKWLRLKYNIPKFGTREQKTNESDPDYQKNILKEQNNTYIKSTLENLGDLTDSDFNKSGAVNDLEQKTAEALGKASDEIIAKTGKEVTSTLSKKAVGLIIAGSAALSIPLYGEIDTAARLWDKIRNDPDYIIKKHAQYAANASIQFATGIAALSDQAKAGLLPLGAAGMVADQFNGMEESQSFNLIDRGKPIGVGLGNFEKINENVVPAFYQTAGEALFGVGQVLLFPLTVWANTISPLTDKISDGTIGKLFEFIGSLQPAKDLYALIQPFLENVINTILQFVGGAIDPTVTGAKRHLFVTQGFTAAFDNKAQDMGMRKLTEAQAQVADNAARADRAETLADMPFTERLFDINNSDSLASTLVASLPTATVSNPVSSIASASMRLVASAPSNFADMTSGSAYAANAPSLESLFGKDAYGALESDLDAPIDPRAYTPGATCPENDPDGNSYNNCKVYSEIAQAWGCSEVKCADLDSTTAVPVAPVTVSGDIKTLATQILESKNITFEDGAGDGAYRDLDLAKNGLATHCGSTAVTLDVNLLQAIVAISAKYKFRINAMVSDHACDGLQHPKGKAVDIGMVNGKDIKEATMTDPATKALYRQFATDMSAGMSTGGDIGQKACLGTLTLQNSVKQINDTCTHIHVDVP